MQPVPLKNVRFASVDALRGVVIALMIAVGVLDQETAIAGVDFNTIMLLGGICAIFEQDTANMPLVHRGMKAGGIFPAIVGTLLLTVGTAAAAIPVGLGAAVYLSEYATDNWFTRVINLAIINLAGVPSIVHALFGVGAFVVFARLGTSILAASLRAMAQAVKALSLLPEIVLVDGPHPLPLAYPQQPVIKGDDRCPSISAAAVLATFVLFMKDSSAVVVFGQELVVEGEDQLVVDQHVLAPRLVLQFLDLSDHLLEAKADRQRNEPARHGGIVPRRARAIPNARANRQRAAARNRVRARRSWERAAAIRAVPGFVLREADREEENGHGQVHSVSAIPKAALER
mgnify:CR=1 FL=1